MLALGGQRYELQLEGQTLGIYGWLRVTNEDGESIRLGPGWSSESCWNALTTLERSRWESPIGEWRDASEQGGLRRITRRRKKYNECKGKTYAEEDRRLATATLTPEKQLTLRKTTLGGALNSKRLTQQLPDTTRLSVDLYLLLGPTGDLLTCNDPEVTSVNEWKQKSTDVLNRFEDLLNSWRALAAA